MARVGGSSSRIPTTSLRNPGVSSSAGEQDHGPVGHLDGGHAAAGQGELEPPPGGQPSRLASQAPATLTTSSNTSVGTSPIQSPTAISTASSASGIR